MAENILEIAKQVALKHKQAIVSVGTNGTGWWITFKWEGIDGGHQGCGSLEEAGEKLKALLNK